MLISEILALRRSKQDSVSFAQSQPPLPIPALRIAEK